MAELGKLREGGMIRWAISLRGATLRAGGQPLAEGFHARESLHAVRKEDEPDLIHL